MADLEQQENAFKDFFAQKIEPLLAEINKKRKNLQNKFWFYFGIVFFINCANILIILFSHILYGKSLSCEQLWLVALVSFLLLFLYVRRINRSKFPDILAEFIQYFGDWKVNYSTLVQNKNETPFLPPHNKIRYSISLLQQADLPIKIKCVDFLNPVLNNKIMKKKCRGVWLTLNFTQKPDGSLYLFEKGGFYKQKKYVGMEKVSSNIPASNYFLTFCDSRILKDYVINTILYENLLDLKEILNASKTYVYYKNGEMNIFFQNGRLSCRECGVWHSCGNAKSFRHLYKQFESILIMREKFQTLMDLAVSYD